MRPVPNLSHSVHQPRGIPVRLTDSGHVPNSGLYFREQTPNSVLSTSNSIEHRKAAETELEALRTLKEAVEYVARQIEFEERQPSAGAD